MLPNKLLVSLIAVGIACTSSSPRASAEEPKKPRPKLDLAFCIDTTGSMQNELDVVKTRMKSLVSKLSAGSGAGAAPDVRVGLVAYRDRGDDFVTKVYQFSDNIDKVVKDISDLKADGGGDAPEAVNQGLHSALNDLGWDARKGATRLLFLIGDAPPNQYKGDYSWKTEARSAIGRGIQINTIACESDIDEFKQIARLADGKYDTLAYRQEVVNADGTRDTVISSAGVAYKVKAEAKTAWKSGVTALSARGLVEKTSTAGGALAADAAAPMLMGRTMAKRGGAFMGGAPASAPAMTRADSNLDEVLLQGARDALARSAKH